MVACRSRAFQSAYRAHLRRIGLQYLPCLAHALARRRFFLLIQPAVPVLIVFLDQLRGNLKSESAAAGSRFLQALGESHLAHRFAFVFVQPAIVVLVELFQGVRAELGALGGLRSGRLILTAATAEDHDHGTEKDWLHDDDGDV